MENTSRATTTGSRPLGTPLLRVSMMARMPRISIPVPITCGADTAAQHRGDQHHQRGLGAADTGTHLVQEAIGEGEVVRGVGGKDGGGFPGARGREGPIAVVPDGVCGAEAEPIDEPGHPGTAAAFLQRQEPTHLPIP